MLIKAALAGIVVIAATAVGVAAGSVLMRFDSRLIAVGLVPVLVTLFLVRVWLGGEPVQTVGAVCAHAVAITAGALALATHHLGHWPNLGPLAFVCLGATVLTVGFVCWSAARGQIHG